MEEHLEVIGSPSSQILHLVGGSRQGYSAMNAESEFGCACEDFGDLTEKYADGNHQLEQDLQ